MLENPSRQLALVLVFIIASVTSLFYKELQYGNDLAGGTELVYEIDPDKAEGIEEGKWDEFMDSTVNTIRDRIDPDGTINAVVQRRGVNGIYIGLPQVTDQNLKEIEAKITRLGTLRMQICAYEDYESEKITDPDERRIFDLTKERDRLQAWLTEDDNKAKLIKDPLSIDRYHSTPTDEGGPLLTKDQLRWVPRKIEGKISKP
jgi:preprotein translocase subunit SecD